MRSRLTQIFCTNNFSERSFHATMLKKKQSNKKHVEKLPKQVEKI